MGIPVNYILHPKELIHPNIVHHPSEYIHQLLEFLFAAVVFIAIYVADRIKRKMDMGNSGILMDGVGNFVALAQESHDLVGCVDHALHAVYIARGEADDEMTDADTGIFVPCLCGICHLVCRLGNISVAEIDDMVRGLGFLDHVMDQIVAGVIVLILTRSCNKFYGSHLEKLLYYELRTPGYCRKGMRNASRGSLIKCS